MENTSGYIAIFVCSFLVAGKIRRRNRIESFRQDTTYQRYQSPIALPFVLLLWRNVSFWMTLTSEGIIRPDIMSAFLGYCVHISLFYTVLLLLLPVLRKCISARACGYLWMFPPMVFPFVNIGLSQSQPLLVIHTPIQLSNVLIIVWAVGFVGILLWYIVSHLYFRRQLLQNAKPETKPEILNLWTDILSLCCFKEPFPQLLRSPNTATPLSIGRKSHSMCVILPQKEYTREELRLIIYHELIHTGRADVNTKLGFSVLAAFFWFNPMMWIALRRITEDMELSCDETTLLCEKDATRHLYADLLLRTAGSRIGFSTCLSASAKSLRYRLKNTLKPMKRASGYIIAGLFCMTTLLFQGSLAFTYDHGTGEEYIFSTVDTSDCTIEYIYRDSYFGHYAPFMPYHCTNNDALYDYLSSLKLYRCTGNYYDNAPEFGYTINIVFPEGELTLKLFDNTLSVSTDTAQNHSRSLYYHGGNIDWDYFQGLLTFGYFEKEPEETLPTETQPKDPPPLPWHK